MNSEHDPFFARFDAIDIDPARAPSPQVIADAFALVAPSASDLAAAGFYLVDDAGGRFVIDREMGVVSLKDEAILETERFAVHTARIRVIEHSGESYEADLRLRLTGRVPQMVGAEDALFDIPSTASPTTTPPQAETPLAVAHWTKYAAAHARAGKAEIARIRRAFITPDIQAPTPVTAHAELSLDSMPPAVGLPGEWSL